MAIANVALHGYYALYQGPISIGSGLGIQQKNFYTFKEASPGIVGTTDNITQEVLFGAHLGFNLLGLEFDNAAYYGHHYVTKPVEVKSSIHLALYTKASHNFFSKRFMASYKYLYDFVSNAFDDGSSIPGQESIVKSYQLSASLAYLF